MNENLKPFVQLGDQNFVSVDGLVILTANFADMNYKRDALFLTLTGIFLTSLVLGNVIGTTKFVTIFSWDLPGWLQAITPALVRNGSIYTMSVPAGVIAYPFTFLATDLISDY